MIFKALYLRLFFVLLLSSITGCTWWNTYFAGSSQEPDKQPATHSQQEPRSTEQKGELRVQQKQVPEYSQDEGKRQLKKTSPLISIKPLKPYKVMRRNSRLIHADTLLVLDVDEKDIQSPLITALQSQFSQVKIWTKGQTLPRRSGFIVSAVTQSENSVIVIRLMDIGTGKLFDNVTVRFRRPPEGPVDPTPEELKSALQEVATKLASRV